MKIKINNKIRKLIERDRKIMFTTTREHYPLVVEKANGDYIYDISGNRFIDFSSFISVYNLGGNGNARIRSAIKKQVDRLMHAAFLDYHAELPVIVAEKLVKMMPNGFGRVFFSNSGTEANEDAIKLAKLFTKRQYLISFYNSFHGRTLGSLGLTAAKIAQRERFGPFPNVIHAPYADSYRCPFNTNDPIDCSNACLDYIENNILRKEVAPEEVAAIFIEPVQGEGGYVVPPKEFIKGIRKIASKYGILLVDDEVQSGFMRTGKFLAMSNFGVDADIYTMAKALGGGLPVGATVARRSLGDTPAGSHAGTFGGNLAAMAAANASLDYVKKNMRSLEMAVQRKGGYIMKRLKELENEYEIVGNARGLGMMIGVELVRNGDTKEPAIKERAKIIEECFYNGLVLLPTGASSIRLIPPLTMSDSNIAKGMDIFEKAIKGADHKLIQSSR